MLGPNPKNENVEILGLSDQLFNSRHRVLSGAEQAAQETGYNFNGVHAPADPERDHYRMSYATFVVPLVKAVQEQQAIITDLQQQINDLRAMVNELQED